MLETLLTALFVITGIVLFVVLNGYLWEMLYFSRTREDYTSYLLTSDGWRLAVHRYCPTKPRAGYPVVLCHGLDSNRFIFDLVPGPSLARFLTENGRDVWVAELRGAGMSDRPGFLGTEVPRDWTFEDHLQYDVPAIIHHVLSETGASRIHWVGHSMGGMLIQAYLAAHSDAPIASAVTAGAPANFAVIRMKALRMLANLRNFLRLFPVAPMPFNGRLILPIAHKLPGFLLGLFHPPNISASVVRKIVAVGSELITSTRLWMDFGRFVATGVYAPENGKPYLENLGESSVPILLLGGSEDLMAPPESIRAAVVNGALGERICHIFGKDQGCHEDYGHIDLVVGERVVQEVYPVILRWLGDKDQVSEKTDIGAPEKAYSSETSPTERV
jgi:pimeloyl-ACP methyl ester carboxylesterase